MTQKKVEKNKAGVDKKLRLANGWEIEKTEQGYRLTDKDCSIFIHGEKIGFRTKNRVNAWLYFHQNDVYITSLWIDNASDIKNIKEFIKVD